MKFRLPARLAIVAVIAPLVFGLAACKKDDAAASGPVAESTPLPKVAAPAGKAWTDVVETTVDGGMMMGNPSAPIKLVEYGSLSCPHCARLAQEGFPKLTSDYVGSGRVSLEYRSFAIHAIDVPLTMLVNCAPKESFFPMVEQIYGNFDALIGGAETKEALANADKAMSLPENRRFIGVAAAQGLTPFFAARGISVDQSNACLSNFAKANEVAAHSKAYGEAGIDSTPTLFINGAKIEGNTWPEIEAALQRAGAR
ncbi:MAG: thioredoxin domain-containing protein [Novosphingobium sp.]